MGFGINIYYPSFLLDPLQGSVPGLHFIKHTLRDMDMVEVLKAGLRSTQLISSFPPPQKTIYGDTPKKYSGPRLNVLM